MLRRHASEIINFESQPNNLKSYILMHLQRSYPKDTRFKAGKCYYFRDEQGRYLGVHITKNLHLIHAKKTHSAWYVESERSALVDGQIYENCYSVSMSLVKVNPKSDPTHFPTWRARYIVNVNFDEQPNKPAARYLASMLPTLSQHYKYSHYEQGLSRLKLDRDVDLMLTLSHPLVPHKSKNDRDQDRFAILGEFLGEGVYSQVIDNPATLRISKSGLFEKKEKLRIARFTFIRNLEGENDRPNQPGYTRYEDGMMELMKDRCRAKPSFFKISKSEKAKHVALRFEKRLPGVNLETFFEPGNEALKSWTLARRLRVAIALFRALHEQVHEKGIIHCDIKPANIMLAEWESDNPVVNIIDFNLSRLKADTSTPRVILGTPLYLSPERFYVRFIPNVASDVFAAAITAAELFGHDSTVVDDIYELQDYSLDYHFINLFGSLPEAKKTPESQACMDQIEEVLMSMVHREPTKRPGLLDAAAQLEQVLSVLIEAKKPSHTTPRGAM